MKKGRDKEGNGSKRFKFVLLLARLFALVADAVRALLSNFLPNTQPQRCSLISAITSFHYIGRSRSANERFEMEFH
jgi:hypothetical protein